MPTLPRLPLALAALLALAAPSTALATAPDPAADAPAAVSAPAPYRDVVLGDRPEAYWHFGEQPGASVAADEVGAFPGRYAGPTLGLSHPIGVDPFVDDDSAIDLDGLVTQPQGQFVFVPDYQHLAFAGRRPFSVEAWVRPRNFNTVTRRIFSKEGVDGGWLLGLRRDGIVFSRYGVGGWDTLATGVDAHRWSHVAATYDGSVMRIYIDGWLAAQQPSFVSLPAADSDLSIGAKQSRYRFYAGGLDEAAIYSHALSYGRVLTHSRAGGDVR